MFLEYQEQRQAMLGCRKFTYSLGCRTRLYSLPLEVFSRDLPNVEDSIAFKVSCAIQRLKWTHRWAGNA